VAGATMDGARVHLRPQCARLTLRLGCAVRSLFSYVLQDMSSHRIAGRLPDGRIVAVGTIFLQYANEEESSEEEEEEEEYHTFAQVLEPPPHGSTSGTSWEWRALG